MLRTEQPTSPERRHSPKAPHTGRLRPGMRSTRKMTFSPYLNRAALTGREAISQMADDCLVAVANDGSVTEADMEALGWTPQQLAAISKPAARLARRLAVA